MRKFLAFGVLFALFWLLGCGGNPFRDFRILDVKVTPTELPPEGGTVQIEVEATRGDGANAIVARKFIGFTVVLFTVKLGSVNALDFEKVRWKGSVQLPPNHSEDDMVYAIIISVRNDSERDERLMEVVVKGRKSGT